MESANGNLINRKNVKIIQDIYRNNMGYDPALFAQEICDKLLTLWN